MIVIYYCILLKHTTEFPFLVCDTSGTDKVSGHTFGGISIFQWDYGAELTFKTCRGAISGSCILRNQFEMQVNQ